MTAVDAGTIDVHTHFVPRSWPDLGPDRPWLRIDSEREAMLMVGTEPFRPIDHRSWDSSARLEEMDDENVGIQVLSPTPVFFSYELSPGEGAKICRIFNELALGMTADSGGRLLPFCQVPLQDTDAACHELERAVAEGHRGVEIGNHVGSRDLDDEGIVTFLQHAASLDVPVFVHPWDMPTSPRLDRWMARWLTGMPAETHLSIVAMVLGGAFDKLPESLRICFAHGGGSFAFWLGRLENAWHRRPDLVKTSEQPPSSYVGRFSVDSVVFNPNALRLLVETLGADKVMIGSDFPYPLGESPVGGVVTEADFLEEADRQMILRGNAETYLGLEPA